jgi:hypothetical protein
LTNLAIGIPLAAAFGRSGWCFTFWPGYFGRLKAESAVTIWTDDTVTESWQPMSTAPSDGTPVIVKTEFSYDG